MAYPINEAIAIDGIRSVFNDPQSSDFILRSQGEIFHVHKTILALRNGFLAGLVSRHFKENALGEANLDEHEPDILKAVLQFVYCIDHDYKNADPAPYFDARLYAAADFFQLPELKRLSKARFEHSVRWADFEDDASDSDYLGPSEIDCGPSNAAGELSQEIDLTVSEDDENYEDVLGGRPSTSAAQFGQKPMDDEERAQACLDVAQLVYSTTPESDRGLRDVIVDVINRHLGILFSDEKRSSTDNELSEELQPADGDVQMELQSNDGTKSHLKDAAQNLQTLDAVSGLARDLTAMRARNIGKKSAYADANRETKLKCLACQGVWIMVNSKEWESRTT